MENYELKPMPAKGLGMFALRGIAQGERIFHIDLRLFKAYSPEELEAEVAKHPELNGDHANYLGNSKSGIFPRVRS
jgi:SET domain-containing protein